jgi:thiamine biosynthesis lipoprotein
MPTFGRKIHKKIAAAILAAILCAFASCSPQYRRFEASFVDVFDTYAQVIAYAPSQKEFDSFAEALRLRLEDLHRKFDIYNNYSGLANLKAVNDSAGIAPVAVDSDIMALLRFGKQAYEETDGAVNVALGPVLKIWHEYREKGLENPQAAELPPMELLEEAKPLCDIEGLILDEAAGTAYFAEKGMSLDVGALAKGFAAGIIAQEAQNAGMKSALINLGGNIVAVGGPLSGGRDSWLVGVQDPENAETGEQNILHSVPAKDAAVVTSGDYQRFYTVGGTRFNHIVDPETLMPASRHAAITVIAKDPATADMLSTCLFILPEEQGRAILERIGGEALWVGHDGATAMTEGYAQLTVEN